jgi:transcriptional regulator with XRE-family HTH domain
MSNTLGAQLQRLGSTIRNERQSLGMSQEAFAEMCHVHRTFIGRVEQGSNVTFETLSCIADALGITVAELMRRARV